MTTTMRSSLAFMQWLAIVLCLGLVAPAQAFHFPWDQGHDTTDWDDPPPPGPCDEPVCDICKSTSSPVYVPTGHFVQSDTDIVLKGRPEIALVRTYNSHDPRDGLFGNGWSVGCDIALYKTNDSGTTKYVLRAADGKRYQYTREPDGSISLPAGRFEQVVPQTDGSVHLVKLDGSYQVFRADGKLAADIDANTNRIDYSYGSDGQLIRIADTNGRYLDLAYTSRGRVANVTDHVGRQWQYLYDTDGNLTHRTDPLGGQRVYEYASFTPAGDGFSYQQLTRITDETGVVVTQVAYNGERVASYTEEGNQFSYSYDTASKTVTKTDSLGSRWTYVYNEQGLITQETDPLGNRIDHVYDTNGRETQTTDEAGKIWQATYDSLGRLISRTNPLDETTTYTFSGDNPNPATITTPSGRVTQITYDDRFNPTSVTGPSGAKSTLQWNGVGDLIATVDALSNRTEITYDTVGQPLTTTDPLGRVAQNGYDAAGNLILIQNAAGETTDMEYDTLDRLVKVTDSLGSITVYAYDAAGRVTSLTDPAGATTAYAFDQYGRLFERTAPDGRKTRYIYRADNLLSQIVRPDNRSISYEYDAAKRLIQEDAAGEISTYGYDARGDLTTAANPGGTITRSYDAIGRFVEETNNGKPVQIDRNSEGERASLTALGLTTTYERDVRGLTTRIANNSGSYEFTYDPVGRRSELLLPNAATVDYGYDAASQLERIAHIDPFSATYGYTFDAVGRITHLSGDGADWGYAYDELGRLTNADHGAESFVYSYDAVGNILNDGRVHDVANRLVEDDTHTYNFDANGNLIQKQEKATGAHTDYTWNVKNQLIRYEYFPDAAAGTATKTLSFTYDAVGRRASKSEDGVVQRYVYDIHNLIGILDSEDNVISSFTFGPNIDEPLGMTTGTGNRYFHANHLGNIMALSGGGAVSSQYEYEPYGNTSTTGEIENPFRYTAREQDAEDLYYYRARYYDPVVGRFISEDPIGLEGGLNLYAYVGGDPVNLSDPFGLVGSGDGPPVYDPKNPPKPPQGIPEIRPPEPLPPKTPGKASCELLFSACVAKCVKKPICRVPRVGPIARAGCYAFCGAVWAICRAGGGE